MRPRLTGSLLAGAIATAAIPTACDDQSYRDIGSEISIIAKRHDALVLAATSRLQRYGRKAIPQIEIALHTASDTGRQNLVAALRSMGDPEAIPILRHVAVYDVSANVRAASEEALTTWARQPNAMSDRAAEALAQVRQWRAAGEAPAVARPTARSMSRE